MKKLLFSVLMEPLSVENTISQNLRITARRIVLLLTVGFIWIAVMGIVFVVSKLF